MTGAGLLLLSSIGAADLVENVRKDGNTLRFALRGGGGAELEWIEPNAFRFYRKFAGAVEAGGAISPDPVSYTLEGHTAKSQALTVEWNPATLAMRVYDPARQQWLTEWESSGPGTLERALAGSERILGIGPRADARLDARGQKITGVNGALLVSTRGYGVAYTGGPHQFDLTTGLRISFAARNELEYVFYHGPRLKDVYERHLRIAPQGWFFARPHVGLLGRLQRPVFAPELPLSVPELSHASLAGNLIPSADCTERAPWWCAYLPVVLGDAKALQAERKRLEPYLLAYFQETKDRGYPVLRPLALQYPTDLEASARADSFMLGDELLVVPEKKPVRLPRGQWTELRTNIRHAGRQTLDLEGVFAKNGSIVPMLVAKDHYELHYFPQLGGEFFLYEVELNRWSQVHAAPAGDFMRLETESKVARDYEWVIHHVDRPLSVECDHKVDWRYDEKRRNLHVRLSAQANGDELINLRFPDPAP